MLGAHEKGPQRCGPFFMAAVDFSLFRTGITFNPAEKFNSPSPAKGLI